MNYPSFNKAIFAFFFVPLLFIFLSLTTETLAQKQNSVQSNDVFRSSATYAEILLKRTDIESELESLLLDYTDEFPKVKELKYSLTILQRDTDKIALTKQSDSGRLTQALGKLIARRVDLETDLWELLQSYKEEHPDVKRAKRRVEIYDRAIKQIID